METTTEPSKSSGGWVDAALGKLQGKLKDSDADFVHELTDRRAAGDTSVKGPELTRLRALAAKHTNDDE